MTYPYTYIQGKFVRKEKAVVPIQCKAIQYGLGIFTGIRANWNNGKLYIFRLKDHYERLKDSAKICGMRFDHSYPKFEKIILDLIKKNKAKSDTYLRVTLYASSTKLTPRFDNNDDDLAIYMIPLKNYFDTKTGLSVCISSWKRIDDDAISTKAKITGGYANSALAKTEAVENGYDEALFLNRDGNVCEATGANLFGVKDGVIFTPPLSANNLDGITRRSLIEIMRYDFGLEVREENFDRSTLYTFDELFLTGTAAKISWIKSVDKRVIGNGKRGRLTKKFQGCFDKITHGENEEYMEWLKKV